MNKRYFILAVFLLALPCFAQDAVFKSSDTEQFDLEPVSYSSSPVVNAQEVPKEASQPVLPANMNQSDSKLSNQSFLDAINNLDTAQVQLREQLATYNTFMAQSKAEYFAKKEEYKGYKQQYKALKKKMKMVEKSKGIIQNDIYAPAGYQGN